MSWQKMSGWVFFPFLIFVAGFSCPAEAGSGACPPEYGKILYECNPINQKQLFIIGMGHRDALTGANGHRTAKIQAEVYKLGEWLIRQEGVELILPEGFFKNPGAKRASIPVSSSSEKEKNSEPLDLKTLEAKLADRTAFINAEILLKRNYPIVLQQVEDRKSYEEVGRLIEKLITGGYSSQEYLRAKAELDSLQEKRTEIILQKIPGLINKEHRDGNIKKRKAILTIGLSHVSMILKYLDTRGTRFYSSTSALSPDGDIFSELTLQEQKFRISILIPKSLAEDPKILKINNLEKILSAPSS